MEKYTVIPNLKQRMVDKQASIHALAARTNLHHTIIEWARAGRRVKIENASKIVISLETEVFMPNKTGRKKKVTFLPKPKCEEKPLKFNFISDKFYPEHNQPDVVHSIALTSVRTCFQRPCEKTEEEIDRLWEYNRMMGRK